MDLPKRTYALADIDWSGSERLGDGTNIDADVFRAKIPSFSDKDIVLKVVSKPYINHTALYLLINSFDLTPLISIHQYL
jgi:hypothetical protein